MTELAGTVDVLRKRVRRLLRLDRGPDDRSELRSEILPMLTSLGSVALIGGAIRDVARAGKRAFASDLDFVIYGGDRDRFTREMADRGARQNKFGGYGLHFSQWKVDVWHIDDTWAKTAGFVSVQKPEDLLKCTFFDWDSVVYEIHAAKLLIPKDYLERLKSRVLDIRLVENPNRAGSLVRALRRAALWGVGFGPRLTAFSKQSLEETSWNDLVDLDSRAFQNPVLRHLNRSSVIQHLNAPVSTSIGAVTMPVPQWKRQLDFPFEKDTTGLAPAAHDR